MELYRVVRAGIFSDAIEIETLTVRKNAMGVYAFNASGCGVLLTDSAVSDEAVVDAAEKMGLYAKKSLAAFAFELTCRAEVQAAFSLV